MTMIIILKIIIMFIIILINLIFSLLVLNHLCNESLALTRPRLSACLSIIIMMTMAI